MVSKVPDDVPIENGHVKATPFPRSEATQKSDEVDRLLCQMTEKVRARLPVELRLHFNPVAPRVILEVKDTYRVADGYLPTAWFDRAAQASGPPSIQVRAMEASAPGLRWPGGRPEQPEERRRLYEMQVDWLGTLAWNGQCTDSE